MPVDLTLPCFLLAFGEKILYFFISPTDEQCSTSKCNAFCLAHFPLDRTGMITKWSIQLGTQKKQCGRFEKLIAYSVIF